MLKAPKATMEQPVRMARKVLKAPRVAMEPRAMMAPRVRRATMELRG